MSGQTAASHPVACGVVAVTCTKITGKRKTLVPLRAAAIANCLKERNNILQTIRVAASRKRINASENRRGKQKSQQDRLHKKYATTSLSFTAALRTNRKHLHPSQDRLHYQVQQVQAQGCNRRHRPH
jgi:uncharacterized protein (UPF0371 family)